MRAEFKKMRPGARKTRVAAKLYAATLVKPKLDSRTGGYLPRRSQRIREQKNKVLNTYVKQTPTVLDNLPLHVIKHDIFSYLDYDSKINLNLCLPIWDRIQTKMNKESLKKHQTNYCVKMASGILTSLHETRFSDGQWVYCGDRRIQRMIQLLNLFLKDEYFFIYTHFSKFRNVFSAKIEEMLELANGEDREEYSRVWLNELISTCHTLRNKVISSQGLIADDYNIKAIPLLTFV